MVVTDEQIEAIEWLQEWAAANFPKRVDGSFPADFITAMRRLMGGAVGEMNYRQMEEALMAGPDIDYKLRHWRSGRRT